MLFGVKYLKSRGQGHFGHRIVFGPNGYLWISSGERQKFDPAQDMEMNLGKVIRLNDDGTIPDDNPFYEQGGCSSRGLVTWSSEPSRPGFRSIRPALGCGDGPRWGG